MQAKEFDSEYRKLESAWPDHFSNPHRKKAIAAYIMDMEHRFWFVLVNRMLVSGNPRLDIEDAARGERLAKKRVEDTNTMLEMQSDLHSKITEEGLQNALQNLGAKSLVDVVGR